MILVALILATVAFIFVGCLFENNTRKETQNTSLKEMIEAQAKKRDEEEVKLRTQMKADDEENKVFIGTVSRNMETQGAEFERRLAELEGNLAAKSPGEQTPSLDLAAKVAELEEAINSLKATLAKQQEAIKKADLGAQEHHKQMMQGLQETRAIEQETMAKLKSLLDPRA